MDDNINIFERLLGYWTEGLNSENPEIQRVVALEKNYKYII